MDSKKRRRSDSDHVGDHCPRPYPSGASIDTKANNKDSRHLPREQQLKQKLSSTRKHLPVYQYRKEICDLVSNNPVVLVVAETGSGKSTQIPAYLYESGMLLQKRPHMDKSLVGHPHHSKYLARTIAVTQPRRVAAMTVARRVADEMGCRTIGTVVGYRVRFDDCSGVDGVWTKILYATDGMLLREATSDALLRRYRVVILDEAHERSLQTDVLFGIVKRAMEARQYGRSRSESNNQSDPGIEVHEESKDVLIRKKMRQKAKLLGLPPLQVVVMSATLQVETFQNFFPNAAVIRIPGRQFEVQVVYTRHPQEDYLDAALSTALQIHADAEEGDVLVFLPGREEIEDLAALLRKHLEQDEDLRQSLMSTSSESSENNKDVVQSLKGMGADLLSDTSRVSMVNGVLVCVLYAALPPEAQMFAFQPKPEGCTRKIILATNIAETSVTLEGIRYVVDCGKHKTRDFSGATGMESLTVHNVSKAQAAQRTGRAGRVSAGVCFRLYTEDAFDSLAATTVPEIQRVNLAQVVLQLKALGVHDPRSFDFVTPPSQQSLLKAFELLYSFGAFDDEMDLTTYGKKLALLPLDPTFAHLLLQSGKYDCTSEILTVVSMLSADNVFYRPAGEGSVAAKAVAAHRRFASHEGDLPTLLAVYQAWRREAIYVPPSQGGRKAQKKRQKSDGKLLHDDWCRRNFVSGRALARALDVRHQLKEICGRPIHKHGLGMDIHQSCKDDMELFYKCACAGMFLQVASRIKATVEVNESRGRSGTLLSSRGRYRTKMGRLEVSIHPTSSMFGRNPAPKCVVYTELLTTKKTYIRGVTQVREEWLQQVAPNFFKV